MKRFFTLAFCIPLLVSACKKDDGTIDCDMGPRNIRVDFQSSFQKDMVRVYLDTALVVRDTILTTNPVLGLAGMDSFSVLRRGEQMLKVVVNNRDSASVPLQLDKRQNFYVGVGYNLPGKAKLAFEVRAEPFVYD